MIIAANRVNHSFIHILYGRAAWLLNVCFVEKMISLSPQNSQNTKEKRTEEELSCKLCNFKHRTNSCEMIIHRVGVDW
jgi:hypothetical protein